jgi:subtilase family protein
MPPTHPSEARGIGIEAPAHAPARLVPLAPAPQVSGTVALMLQANPNLAPNTVKGILMYTSQRLARTDAQGAVLPKGLSNLTQGAGSLNAIGAVEVATKIDPGVSVGQGWLRAPLSKQSTIFGRTFTWAQHVLWSNRMYSGDAVLGIHQAIRSDQAIWSDQAICPTTASPPTRRSGATRTSSARTTPRTTWRASPS